MGSESSFSIPVSSISVVSVPLEDVAIGEGSGMSVGLEARGEATLGGWRELVYSLDLDCQRNNAFGGRRHHLTLDGELEI